RRDHASGDRGLLRGGLPESRKLQRRVLASDGFARREPSVNAGAVPRTPTRRTTASHGWVEQAAVQRRNFGEAPRSSPVAELPGARRRPTVRITLVSIFVENQDRALAFYRDVLGFVPKVDIPMGKYRWLTVVAPDRPGGPELVLEPNAHPAARAFQDA